MSQIDRRRFLTRSRATFGTGAGVGAAGTLGVLAVGGLLVLRLLFDDVDAERCDLFEQIVHPLGRDVLDVVEDGIDLFVRQRAAFLAGGQ